MVRKSLFFKPSGRRAAFRCRLLKWYRESARSLPWRENQDAYRIWISEIMLQQTRVDTVLRYYAPFLKKFPDVRSLAKADPERVLKAWEGLGYYSRARNLQSAARQLAERPGFPRTAEEWRRLPGIGRYSAAAIASMAFQESAPVLDGNVKRVLARLAMEPRPVAARAVELKFWNEMDLLVQGPRPGDLNQAMMELGACLCTPAAPRCPDCPVKDFCLAGKTDAAAEFPARSRPKRIPHQTVVAALLFRNQKFLIGKRPSHGLLGGLWEFPGGKKEPGETLEEALRREAREELGVAIGVESPLPPIRHAYSHFSVTLHPFRCRILSGRPAARYHQELRWIRMEDICQYAFPRATQKILEQLCPVGAGAAQQ